MVGGTGEALVMWTLGKALILAALLFGETVAGDTIRAGGERDAAVADAVRDAVLDA